MTKAKGMTAAARIAVMVFHMKDRHAGFLRWVTALSDYSEQEGLGVTWTPTANAVLVSELWPGAVLEAVKNDNWMVGVILRRLRDEGSFSLNQQILKAIDRRQAKEQNSAIRQDIRDRRNSKAELVRRAEQQAIAVRFEAYRRMVDDGRAFVDQDVRASIDCRDVAVDAPVDWSKGVPMPIVGSQVWIDRTYTYKKRTREVQTKG
jgi:hypothetical protein